MSGVATATILAGAGLALGVGGMAYSLLSPKGGGVMPQQQQISPPSYTDPAVQAAARAQETAEANAKGRASTILTGGLGDTSDTTTAKRSLLGVG